MSAPSAPQIVPRPRPTTSSIQFFWQPPASDGGSPIIKYTLESVSPAFSQDISANQSTYTVTGLSAGTFYTFTLTATNAVGTSSPATFRTVQVGTTTFGPTQASVSTLNASTALVTWNISTVASAASIEWITVRCIPSTPAMSSFVTTEYPYNFSTLVEGLSTNIYYRFLVQAVNDIGYCPPFAFTSTVGFGLLPTFGPSTLTNLVMWLDPSDSTRIGSNSAGNVSTLLDKSANNYRASNTAYGSNNWPTKSGNYLQFNNNRHLWLNPASVNNASNYTFFLVFNPVSSNNWIMAKQSDFENTYNVWTTTFSNNNGNTGTSRYMYWFTNNSGTRGTSAAVLSNVNQLLCIQCSNAATLRTYRNGVLLNTQTAGDFTMNNDTSVTAHTIGASISQGGFVQSGVTNFNMGEMLIYNSNLAAADRSNIESYLMTKWGI
jgi:hypothetical protein